MSTPESALEERAGKSEALAVQAIGGFGSRESFELLQRGATLLAASTLVPKEYQSNVANCAIALNMSHRIGADPLMVMQNLYIVHGRPGWSSQFLIATFNQSGRFSALRYTWVGEPGADTWGCYASSVEKDTGEKLIGATITLALAKAEGWVGKAGSKWLTMPEQMLMYRSAAWFVRAYAPELAMGLHTADELNDIDEQPIRDVPKRTEIPDVLLPLFDQIGWTQPSREMWLGRRHGQSVEHLTEQLREEIARATTVSVTPVPAPAKAEPEGAAVAADSSLADEDLHRRLGEDLIAAERRSRTSSRAIR